MAYWLVKEEPDHYSWSDLERDGSTDWDGVHNAAALLNLRTMKVGDRAMFYHTGTERACVGIVEIAGAPRPDPRDDRGSWMVEVRAVRALRRPVPLSEIKADPAFAGFDLIRIGRLSVVRVPDRFWERLLVLERGSATPAPDVKAGPKGRARGTARRTRRPAARRRR